MEREKILHKLKTVYGLKPKQLLILRTLSDAKPLTAEKLSRLTSIPLGRIYAYLNKLIAGRLIHKTTKKPYQYHVADFKKTVLDFMHSERDKYISTEREVLDLMKGDAPGQMELIKTKTDYAYAHLKLIAESRHIRLMCFHRSFPFLLYPAEFEDFLAFRREVVKFRETLSFVDPESLYLIYRAYHQALDRGKKFELIVEKWTVLDHLALFRKKFGEESFRSYLAYLKKFLRSGKVSVRVIEEYIPMEIDIGDMSIVLALSHLNLYTGLSLRNPGVFQLYNTLFEQKLARTEDILTYLREQ